MHCFILIFLWEKKRENYLVNKAYFKNTITHISFVHDWCCMTYDSQIMMSAARLACAPTVGVRTWWAASSVSATLASHWHEVERLVLVSIIYTAGTQQRVLCWWVWLVQQAGSGVVCTGNYILSQNVIVSSKYVCYFVFGTCMPWITCTPDLTLSWSACVCFIMNSEICGSRIQTCTSLLMLCSLRV